MRLKRWQVIEFYDGKPAQLGRHWTRWGASRHMMRVADPALRYGGSLAYQHFHWAVRPI